MDSRRSIAPPLDVNPIAVADTVASASPLVPAAPVPATVDAAAPSTTALLARAARLGPARPTVDSVLLPTDPVLGQKLSPRVAERRVRFQKIVKATLGGCVALCIAALVATAAAGEAAAAPRSSAPASNPSLRTASVESLAGSPRAKASRRPTGTPTTAHASKARGGKRH